MDAPWLPVPGQLALVEVPDRDDPLVGIVTGAGGDTITIDLTSGAAPADGEVTVSFIASDALYRAAAAGVRRRSASTLDVVVGDMERVQRRRVPRVRVQYPITVTAEKGEDVRGETLDVGPGGCRFTTSHHVGDPQTVKVVIELLDGPPVKATGRLLETRRETGGYEYRLAFSKIGDDDVDRLRSLAAES